MGLGCFRKSRLHGQTRSFSPCSRAHLTRFHGTLAPAAKSRPSIVPSPELPLRDCFHAPATDTELQKESDGQDSASWPSFKNEVEGRFRSPAEAVDSRRSHHVAYARLTSLRTQTESDFL